MTFLPCLVRSSTAAGEVRFELGHPLLDRYLEFVAGRTRPNTVRAVAFDLKTFFTVVDKDPVEVEVGDVFDFLAHQRGDRTVVRMVDRESGLSARTIARRLSSVSGFYAYLIARGDTVVSVNPVPRGLSTRRRGGRTRTVPGPSTGSSPITTPRSTDAPCTASSRPLLARPASATPRDAGSRSVRPTGRPCRSAQHVQARLNTEAPPTVIRWGDGCLRSGTEGAIQQHYARPDSA